MKKNSSINKLCLIGLSGFIHWTDCYSSSPSNPIIRKNNQSEIILEIKQSKNPHILNLTDFQKKTQSTQLTYSEYKRISLELAQAKALFEKALTEKCGTRFPKEDKWDRFSTERFTPQFVTMVADKTATPGPQARQKQRTFTASDWEHEFFCNDLSVLHSHLFSEQSFYQPHVDLAKFIEKKGVKSCQSDDYLKYVNQIKNYEISNQCKNIQGSTQPFCLIDFHKPDALDPIGFAKELSQSLSQLISQSLPIYEQVIKNAENDLKKLQMEISEQAEAMRKAGIGTPGPGQDNLRPPTVDQLIATESRRRSKPYADIINTRKELIQIGKEFQSELQKPIRTVQEANKRIESLIRYAPHLVDQAFSELEAWSDCNLGSAQKIRKLKINLCENFNRSKAKNDRDQKIIDILNSFSEIAYIGSAGTALTGNLPLSTGLMATGAVSGVASKTVKYFTEDDLTRHRAVSTAIFGNLDAAEAYLNIRENSAKNTLNEIALEAGLGLVPLSLGRLSKLGTLSSRFETGLERLTINQPELIPTLKEIQKKLTSQTKKAIDEAHKVGLDSKLAGKPFTEKELLEKVRILEKAGFNETERAALIRSGVTGQPSRVQASITKNNPTKPLSKAELSADDLQDIRKVKKHFSENAGEVIVNAKNFDEARNLTYNLNFAKSLGFEHSSHTRTRFISNFQNSVYYGKPVGWEIVNAQGQKMRIRMDWDPTKGAHFNVEFFKIQRANSAVKDKYNIAIQFPCKNGPCTEQEALDLLKQLLP